MDENHQRLPRLYTPQEVADMFGLTVDALKRRRQRGQIEGETLSTRMTVYTEAQIQAADLSRHSPGPKRRRR